MLVYKLKIYLYTKWGLCMFNLKFNDYTVNKYKLIREFHEGLARVQNNKGLWGFINKKGEEVIPCQFKDAKDFSEGLAPVCNEEGKWEYIDKRGKLVISCQDFITCSDEYTEIGNFYDGIARIRENYFNYFYINMQGKKTTKNVLKRAVAVDFKNGFGIVRYYEGDEARYSYIDKNGELFGEYAQCSSFDECGFAVIQSILDGKFYIINREFELVRKIKDFPKTFIRNIVDFSNGMVLFNNSKYDYLIYDYENDEFLPSLFNEIKAFKDNVAIVETRLCYNCHREGRNSSGFIRKDGFMKFFSENIYREIRDFHNGLAAAKNIEGLWGFINKKGKEAIPCQFKSVTDFSEGLSAVVDKDNNMYFIDTKGNKKLEMPVIYCSTLEIEGLEFCNIKKKGATVSIEADNLEGLNDKKFQVLSIVREIVPDKIDEGAHLITPSLKRTRKHQG